MHTIENFKIIGIAIETTNENGQAAADLGKLWERFYKEDIPGLIPNKSGEEVYSIYTDYDSDYKGKYTTLIGQKVNSLDDIPNGLIGREFEGGTYQKFLAKGPMPQAVVAAWQDIWAKEESLNRKYSADLEVYGAKSQAGEQAEVELFIAIR